MVNSIQNNDDYYKGYNDYGKPEILKLLGFKPIEESLNFKNYDPKRFNQLWSNGEINFYSDGHSLLKNDNYVYNFGKNDKSSIEYYFKVPKELEYLKNISKIESWRILNKSDAKSILGDIIDSANYDEETDYMLGNLHIIRKIGNKYLDNIDLFGDKIVYINNILNNLYTMSGRFYPHVPHLTPQCGEQKSHQKILEKFVEINKSYCEEE